MTRHPDRAIKFERSYECEIEHLWQLWTSKGGFESWWGPEGFRAEVRKLDPKPGGELIYDMLAVGEEKMEILKRANMPASHTVRARFVDLARHERIHLSHLIDFIPGIRPYEHQLRVVFISDDKWVHMLLDADEHVDAAFTQAATLGMESQLAKVTAALAAFR